MSGHGRGGGGGGGRAKKSQSPGRGGRGGAGPSSTGGRGRGSAGSTVPAMSAVGSPSDPSLSREVHQKLTLAPAASSSAPAHPTPHVEPSPVQKSSQSTQAQSLPAKPVQIPPASSLALRPPPRPGYGKAGRRCVVKANHFLVEVADRDLHHYDVSISPEISSKKVCRDIIDQLVKSYRESHLGKKRLAYDGRKSAYTAGPLPFSSKDFVVKLQDQEGGSRRDRDFKVSIKFAAKADLGHLRDFLHSRQFDAPQETIQVLDVVLRGTPSMKYAVIGRSFFHPSLGRKGELGDGIEYWKGFYQSLRPTQMGLSLNIDISARGFYEPFLVSEFVATYFNRQLTRPLSDQDRIKLKRVLKGNRIEVTHTGHVKRYKISGISALPMSQLMFSLDDSGAQTSVVQYFRQRYDITLRYTFLPAIQTGSDAKPVYLPMEICKILEGQRYAKRLNEKQVRNLLRATCQRPAERESDIKQMVERNNYNEDILVGDFGIQVGVDLTRVDARVLQPPMLKYHDSGKYKQVEPTVGQWNMIDKKMVNGGKVDFWTCICFSRANCNAELFCKELITMCRNKGMDFSPNSVLPFRYVNSGEIERALHDIHMQSTKNIASMGHPGKQLQLLIVILPDVSGHYGKIKRVCETELGIVTQCCQPMQAKKNNVQYRENVAMKINVKVGGRNLVLMDALTRKIPYLTDMPTIVFGADVTHPQPGEDSSPSIAAVVASMDWPEVTKYRALVSAQLHRKEIIEDLYMEFEDPQKGFVRCGMIREHLIAFRRSTGMKPGRIIFYRDGVSEGQFNEVLLNEMDKIRKACVSLEEGYLPRVTFVVVQKRHHTRLFAARHGDRNSTDKSGNILPGTVVDTKICHPTQFDFYLCSHAGIQGTSRPTHYHVLYDENGFSADALQTLTNSLCYTYARCTRSVSIVPPAYYAHLAAFRARYYIEDEVYEGGSSSGGGGRATRESNTGVRPLPKVRDNVKDVMFYC